MLKNVLDHCAALSTWKVISYGLIFGVLVELITIALRYGFRLESTRDTAASIGTLTFGLRVHHGYIGLFLVPLAWCFPLGLRHALWIIAVSLIFSDFVHHFFVLWPIEGSPQFDFVYPTHPYWKKDVP